MNNNERIKKITDASIICAIYAIFLFISRISGLMLEYDLFFLLPVPLIIYAFKYNVKDTLVSLSATFLISFLIINFLSVLCIVLPSLILGMIYGGIFLKKKKRISITFLILVFICVVKELLVSVVFSSFFGIENIYVELSKIADFIIKIVEKYNLSFITKTLISSICQGLVPFFIFSISIFETIAIMILSKVLLSRLKLDNNIKFGFPVFSFPKALSIIYFCLILLLPLGFYLYTLGIWWVNIISSILINSYLLLSLFMLYDFIGYILFSIMILKRKLFLLLVLFGGIIIFPLGAFIGALDIFLNLKLRVLLSFPPNK